MKLAELLLSLVVILAGAELFTNGIEWVGEQLGLSEGAVGSVLAAVGTALPETILPLIAIIVGGVGNEQIGIGSILGAPFMLTTLAMFVLGVAVLVFSRGGRRSTELDGEDAVISQDLGYFLATYSLAVVAGLIDSRPLHVALAVGLMVGYGYYVRRHFATPGKAEEESEARNEVKPLYLWQVARRPGPWSKDSPHVWTYTQVAVGLVLIIGGARLFIDGIDWFAAKLGVPPLVFALLVAPIATELPEKFNSVLWVRRRKDTLALGNLTGAMVFQSCFPVSVGLLLTPWRLAHEALVAAVLALIAGLSLWISIKVRGKYRAGLLLLQGAFYLGYVMYVLFIVLPDHRT